MDVVLDARAGLAESPVWDAATGVLWWIDMSAGRVHRFRPAPGGGVPVGGSFAPGGPVGSVALRHSGGLLLAGQDTVRRVDDRGEVVGVLARLDAPDPAVRFAVRFNDGKCDPAGRFWVGTAGRESAGHLYRLDTDGRLSVQRSGVTTSNGLGWSPEGDRMYYVDTPTLGVDVLDFDLDAGTPHRRRRLATVPAGRPDGLAVDVEGCVWVALWDGGAVHRYTPDGVLDRVLHLPVDRVTSCAFGGPGLRTLFVTTASVGLSDAQRARQPHAGSIFAVDPSVAGVPVGVFPG